MWSRSSFACVAVLLLATAPAQDPPSAAWRVAFSRERLWEGFGDIEVVARQTGADTAEVTVTVTHTRYTKGPDTIVDTLDYTMTAVRVRATLDGPSLVAGSQHDANGESTNPDTHRSAATAKVEARFRSTNGKVDPSAGATLAIEIFEPHLSTRRYTVPLAFRDLRTAPCREELGKDDAIAARLRAIELRIVEWNARVAAAARLRGELDTALARAEGELRNTSRFLTAGIDAEAAFEKALDEARLVEDYLGIGEVAFGLGKLGTKLLTKYCEKVAKFAYKDPRKLNQLRRMLGALGESIPAPLERVMRDVDVLRRDAARQVLDEMKQGEFVRTAGGLGDGLGPMAKDPVLSGSVRDALVDGKLDSWKGLKSDIDVEFATREHADYFEARLADVLNDSLENKGFGRIAASGDVAVNTFVGNPEDVWNRSGLDAWTKSVTDPQYLANPDCFRTLANQKMARYYGAEAVDLVPLDGYEIVKEMSARAEIYHATRNYLDPDTFQNIKKCYERALVGEAAHAGTVSRVSKTAPALEAQLEAIKARDGLLHSARQLGLGDVDAELAQKMVDRLKQMEGALGVPPAAGSPQRKMATDLALGVLDAERKRDLFMDGMKVADRARAHEIQLPGLMHFTLSNGSGARLGLEGLAMKYLGNPVTETVAATLGRIAWSDPGVQDLADARYRLGQAAHALRDAEAWWQKLDAAVATLPEDELRAIADELDRALAATPPAQRECFALIAGGAVSAAHADAGELSDYVQRLRELRAAFPKAQLLARLDEYLDLAGLGQREQEALRRAKAAQQALVDGRGRELDLKRRVEAGAGDDMREAYEQAKHFSAVVLEGRKQVADDELAAVRSERERAIEGHRRLEATLPEDLRFHSIAQALDARRDDSVGGRMEPRLLEEYVSGMRGIVEGIRAGERSSGDWSAGPGR